MKKSTRATILQLLLFLVSLVFIYFAFGKNFLFGYIGFVFGSAFLVLGAIFIGVVAFFRIKHLLQKLYPIQETDPSETHALEVSSYKKYSLILEILITVGTPIGAFLSYKLMVWLSKLRVQLLTGIFVVPVQEWYWIIPAIFIGLLFGILIGLIGMKIILRGDRYKSFIKYLEILSLGMDSKKLLGLIIISFFLLNSILIFVGLTTYTRVTEEGIYTHRASQLSEEFHPYTQVAKIEEQIRTQKTSMEHLFRIQFTDGRQWEPVLAEGDNDIPESYPPIMKFISQKSGQPFIQVETK